jgi:hypothetical protein
MNVAAILPMALVIVAEQGRGPSTARLRTSGT